jgi:addiction module RelB/DinJ family antitoxin
MQQINIRLDPQLKKEVEEIAAGIGLGLNDVFRVMAKKFAENRGFPFDVVYPYEPNYNAEVKTILLDAKAGKDMVRVGDMRGLSKFLGIKNA